MYAVFFPFVFLIHCCEFMRPVRFIIIYGVRWCNTVFWRLFSFFKINIKTNNEAFFSHSYRTLLFIIFLVTLILLLDLHCHNFHLVFFSHTVQIHSTTILYHGFFSEFFLFFLGLKGIEISIILVFFSFFNAIFMPCLWITFVDTSPV